MIANLSKSIAIFAAIFAMNSTFASNLPADGRVDIWPSIPFVRGADLCRYSDAYGQTRAQYMGQMMKLASQFYYGGVYALTQFNDLYERNVALASQNNYLDVTLESTFKGYMDSYYRKLKPKVKKIVFSNAQDVLTNGALDSLDYIAYGTYTLAPDCAGDIQITLHLTGKNGDTESYVGHGKPSVVMSQIASEIFSEFQRTQFPSEIKVGNKILTLIGGLSGSVDTAINTATAERSCETLDARLPTQTELEILDGYGDWSGGVGFNDRVWAMSNGKVYASNLDSENPVRDEDGINVEELFYYCVK